MTRYNYQGFKEQTGLTAALIDSIRVFLRPDTIAYMGACNPAQEYWEKKYGLDHLEVTAKNLVEFARQEDWECGGRIDVRRWICDNLGWWVDSRSASHYYEFKTPNLSSYKMAERWLKVILIAKYEPEAYFRLGGRLPRAEVEYKDDA